MPHISSTDQDDSGGVVFPPVSKDHVQNCSYDSWFPRYRSSCLKSRIIPLPPAFVSYLHEDGIILADDEEEPAEDSDEWHSSAATASPKPQPEASDDEDDEDSDEDSPRLPPNQRFPETHKLIKDKIAELGGSVAPKLNWSSPKDAKWISPHQNTLKCTSPNDIYLLLKSSSFVSHDLVHAFDGCTAAAPSRPFAPVLVLRPFFTPHVALEFRCFVKHRSLIGITQRDINYYAFLEGIRPQLWKKITTFFEDKLRFSFPDACFTFDVYVPENSFEADGLGKVRLMDINPWAPRTDSLLFGWEELLEKEVKHPLYGSAGNNDMEESGDDFKAEDTEDESEIEYRPEMEPEFRIVERDDPAAYNFSSAQYSAHKLPKEVVDASLAGEGGLREFAQQWKEITEAPPAPTVCGVFKRPAMPPRGRGNKVIKSRHDSRQSSLSSTAQEQLEQFVQQANSNVGGGGGGDDAANAVVLGASTAHIGHKFNSPVDLNATNVLANGNTMGALDSPLQHALGPHDDFQVDQGLEHQQDTPTPQAQTPQPTELPQSQLSQTSATGRNAAEVALTAYGDLVKIDSALCKKLAGEVALREPTQRRHDQKLNIERRSNVEALLAHMTGELAPRPCKNCHKGHGPWTQCVVYDENNNPLPPQTIYAPPVAAAPPVVAYQAPSMAQPPTASLDVAALHADIHQWGLTDPTRRLVSQAMGDVATFSRRERYIARIEAAAKELGMRIAEYDEYLRSPEGLAETQRNHEQGHAHIQPHDGLTDDAMSPASVLR
ncbi:Cell division cycle protein [Paramyrothecium foliicola]|nr:Cell division cycle protein [Paramyrothecium foliicola]